MQLLNKVREEVATIAKVEAEPKLEGARCDGAGAALGTDVPGSR